MAVMVAVWRNPLIRTAVIFVAVATPTIYVVWFLLHGTH